MSMSNAGWWTRPRAELLVVKYEDLQASAVRELQRFCAFAGLQREDAHLERIVQQATFTKARAKEDRLGWDNKDWPRDHPIVRRGQVGSWRDEMPADVLAAFLEKAGATLERFGYNVP